MRQFISVLLLMLTTAGAMAQITLSGEVVDSTTSVPLAYCVIEEGDQRVIADQEGRFVLTDLKKGWIELNFHYLESHYFKRVFVNSDLKVQFALDLHDAHIPTAVVHGHKHESDEVAASKFGLTKGQLEKKAAINLGDALEGINGVTSLKTGGSIAKPVINGMHSNRVAIISSGSRLENQQWGTEHAPGLDPLNGGSLEVLKGASTLIYGNDAIGGVIRMIPGAFVESQSSKLKLFTRVESNPAAAHLGLQYERFDTSLDWGNRLSLNVKKAGDAYAPDYVLSNTGYSQLSGNYFSHFHLGAHQFSVNLSSFNQILGILSSSHIGNQSDLIRAIESDTPLIVRPYTFEVGTPYQQVRHHTGQMVWDYETDVMGALQLSFTHQLNHRDEFDNHGRSELPALSLSLATSQLNLLADKHWENWRLEYGALAERQENTFAGRYFIPNYLRNKLGGYGVSTFEQGDFLFELGARYDLLNYSTFRYEDNVLKNEQFDFRGWSSSIGIRKTLRERFKLGLSLSRKFRAPQINELFSDGLHHGSASLEFGDLTLEEEIVYSITPSLQFKSSKWSWNIEPYFHLFEGFINLEPTNESQLSIRGAFPVFEYQQTDVLYSGLDAQLAYNPVSYWTLGSAISVVHAKQLNGGLFVYGVPAPKITSYLKHTFKPNSILEDGYMQVNSNYVFEHKWADLEHDFTSPPEAYFLLDLEVGKYFKKVPSMVVLEFRNVLNQRYRAYMNRYRYFADEQGFQFSITFNYTLKNTK